MASIHSLSPRYKWSAAKENLTKGDVVLVINENAKRGEWKMAQVTAVHAGEDDLVRVMEVKFTDGLVLKRPITKLVLLMKRSKSRA
jgi:hypothetical protein